MQTIVCELMFHLYRQTEPETAGRTANPLWDLPDEERKNNNCPEGEDHESESLKLSPAANCYLYNRIIKKGECGRFLALPFW